MYGKGHKVEKRSRLKHALVSNAQVCILNDSTHREQFSSPLPNSMVM